MMQYRKLTSSGDYSFGAGGSNFWVNSPAGVLQAIGTRLKLFQGEWALDTTQGVPYSTEIFGNNTEGTRDLVVQEAILGTQGVLSISAYSSSFDSSTRKFSVAATVDTIYGSVQYNGVL